jgi:signal peptidase II
VNLFEERRKKIMLALGLSALNYGLDRITKFIALRYLRDQPPLVFLNRLFVLVYRENTGAFLSMGAGWNIYIKYAVLLIIPILVCLGGLLYLMFRENRTYRIISLSCVIGGGIGNLTDRLFNDFRVIDFMNFGIGELRTGVLNVADLSVTFGALCMVLLEWWDARRERKR